VLMFRNTGPTLSFTLHVPRYFSQIESRESRHGLIQVTFLHHFSNNGISSRNPRFRKEGRRCEGTKSAAPYLVAACNGLIYREYARADRRESRIYPLRVKSGVNFIRQVPGHEVRSYNALSGVLFVSFPSRARMESNGESSEVSRR